MTSTLRCTVGILVSLALVLCFAPARAEPTFPALTGRVVDDANLLTPADKQALTADLKALEDKSSDQLVVVTLPSLQGYAIEDYGYQLGRHWGIGKKQLMSPPGVSLHSVDRRGVEVHYQFLYVCHSYDYFIAVVALNP
jgi:hypothetical protein